MFLPEVSSPSIQPRVLLIWEVTDFGRRSCSSRDFLAVLRTVNLKPARRENVGLNQMRESSTHFPDERLALFRNDDAMQQLTHDSFYAGKISRAQSCPASIWVWVIVIIIFTGCTHRRTAMACIVAPSAWPSRMFRVEPGIVNDVYPSCKGKFIDIGLNTGRHRMHV